MVWVKIYVLKTYGSIITYELMILSYIQYNWHWATKIATNHICRANLVRINRIHLCSATNGTWRSCRQPSSVFILHNSLRSCALPPLLVVKLYWPKASWAECCICFLYMGILDVCLCPLPPIPSQLCCPAELDLLDCILRNTHPPS